MEAKYYKLLQERNWEIDLDHLESLVDENTKVLMVINPSNPCGSVFSKKHQLEIIAFAHKHKLPIIADEVYYGMNFGDDTEFHSFGNLTKEVPIICTSSLSKMYCVPGWRTGWCIVYNNNGYFDRVKENMRKVSVVHNHPCTLI